jgi:REP element-mobilizing transposase RayT
MVNQLKGYSSRLIRKNLPEDVLPFLWGDSFWSDGFFYESIGRVTTETITFYIERQQGKHWEPAELEPSYPLVITKEQTTLQQFGA